MLRELYVILVGSCFFLIDAYSLKKKYNDIRKICMGRDDESIKGIVVGKRTFLYTGDIHPIVSCNINGSEMLYQYRFFYTINQFPLGKEVELKISRISGLPYDKKDLIKDILFYIFCLAICGVCTVAGLYHLFFLR